MKKPRYRFSTALLILFMSLIGMNTKLLAQAAPEFGYAKNAISINDRGDIIEGESAIHERNLETELADRAYKPEFGVVANRDSSYYYEIGSFYSGGVVFGYVQVLAVSDQEKQLELEFFSRQLDFTPALVEIDRRREEWIQLCNAHNAAALINELYSENTMYYNHKPLVVGRPGLIQDYQYMNRESYSLMLTPLKTEQVNENIVLEVGQCSGSYGGKYIIVWKKSDEGKWEVFLDSNI
ncbi:MAG: hypothetical protein R8G66_19120 [Cytophagales bacterium]|nr:hypothetical protein [Cytophagales bacterium]